MNNSKPNTIMGYMGSPVKKNTSSYAQRLQKPIGTSYSKQAKSNLSNQHNALNSSSNNAAGLNKDSASGGPGNHGQTGGVLNSTASRGEEFKTTGATKTKMSYDYYSVSATNSASTNKQIKDR